MHLINQVHHQNVDPVFLSISVHQRISVYTKVFQSYNFALDDCFVTPSETDLKYQPNRKYEQKSVSPAKNDPISFVCSNVR